MEKPRPWKASDYARAAKWRRAKLKAKRGKGWHSRRPPGRMSVQGPCVPYTEVLSIDGGISAKLFKSRERVNAGKGHRLASFDRQGNRVGHPRYADIKQCLACGRTLSRVHAPKPGTP